MAPSSFPLRWESTGDKWWYASPIDWAAANGHYDLVRELLRLDGNHLIQLTSLRRVRRLEAVWDDDQEQFHDVTKCRCKVAHQLFDEIPSYKKGGKHPLIVGGYGGWLLYIACSAGDLSFVKDILGINPLLVFGDGEYGLTDILYAASRSKNLEVFRVIYGFAATPRFSRGKEEQSEMVSLPTEFKLEVKNRGVHAAARGGHLMALKELLDLDSAGDVLEYRDLHGSTILHAAAGKGQVEVVKYLVASYDMISSTDNEGNTPFHIAAYKGQLSVLETLLQSSPSSASLLNKLGNTFLHMTVTGFQTTGFRRLDRQIELIKHILTSKFFNIQNIINSQNFEGKTALHLGIIGDVHSNLVEQLMSVWNINVNICDNRGMTPLDYLKRQPQSPSSEKLIRRLVSVGGKSSSRDIAVRKAFASHLKMQSICISPGASFKVPDNEIFLRTGIDRLVNSSSKKETATHFRSSHFRSLSHASQCESSGLHSARPSHFRSLSLAASQYESAELKKSSGLHSAKKHGSSHFRTLSQASQCESAEITKSSGLHSAKKHGSSHFQTLGQASQCESAEIKKSSGLHSSKKHGSSDFRTLSQASQCESAEIKKLSGLYNAKKHLKTMLHWPLTKRKETEKTIPISLRERFSSSGSVSSNKRTLAVRSNISSPTNRKKFALGVGYAVLQDQHIMNTHFQAESFSRSSISSFCSLDYKGKGVGFEDEISIPSCSKHVNVDNAPVIRKQGSIGKRFMNPNLWFGGHHASTKSSIRKHSMKQVIHLAA